MEKMTQEDFTQHNKGHRQSTFESWAGLGVVTQSGFTACADAATQASTATCEFTVLPDIPGRLSWNPFKSAGEANYIAKEGKRLQDIFTILSVWMQQNGYAVDDKTATLEGPLPAWPRRPEIR